MTEKLILSLKDVQTNIGQFHILEGVSLDVPVKKATVMLGRNGAGKTTTLESIMGLRPAFAGSIKFDDKEIIKKKDYLIPRMGIGYVPEDREIFTHLTVEQNLYISSRQKKIYKDRLAMIFDLFPDMEKYRHKKAGILSGGQAQMLSISRSLINDNKIILIDEPSKGLAPLIIHDLVSKINEIKANCSILMVEQNFEMATAIGDLFYIIAEGRTVMTCGLDELLSSEKIKNEYLGLS